MRIGSHLTRTLSSGLAPLALVLIASAPAAGWAQVTSYTSLASFEAAAPSATTYDFSSLDNGSLQVLSPTVAGVNFNDTSASGGINFLIPAGGISGPNYGAAFYSDESSCAPNCGDILTTITPGPGVYAFGLTYGWYLGGGGLPFSISINGGPPIAATMPGADGVVNETSFIGFTASSPIASIVIDTPETPGATQFNDGFDVINFSYSTAAAVPEPGQFALMLAGLLGLGILQRRVRTS